MSNDQIVSDWISNNFDLDSIHVIDYPLFPSGKRIIDHNGDHMVVFYDLLHDCIRFIFPNK